MSNAKPMSLVRRHDLYVGANGFRWYTPRQRRRAVHKANRHEPAFIAWQDGAKNHETPRRADARAAMLARRA